MTLRFPWRIVWIVSLLGFGANPDPALGQSVERGASPPSTRTACPQEIQIEGIRISFCALGQGPPVLFLHGLGGSWKDWEGILPLLASRHEVLALDFPGFGGSEAPSMVYSIEGLTGIVESFLKERKLSSLTVVGHSMGALVALNLAARPHSPVAALVICDAVGVGDKTEFLSYALTRKFIGPDSPFEPLGGALQGEFRAMIRDFVNRQNGKTSREFFESLPKIPFSEKPLLPMTPAVQLAASIIDFDIRPKLPSIRQPTLILWGLRDPVAPPSDAEFLHGQLPAATLFFFPAAGHSPMKEEPALFMQELNRFLQATASGSSK
jgi:pimeloyl-ACP methyl ester carboxylesterase